MFKLNLFGIQCVNNNGRFILTFILSILLILNCNTRKHNSPADSEAHGGTGSDVFQIQLWQGGGFTGLKTGFSLSSTGEVTQWQRYPGRADSILWIIKGYRSEVNTLKNRLVESGALGKQYSEYGNMTFGIDFKTTEKNYTWTWSQLESEDKMAAELTDWYQNALKFCQSVVDK